jgi:hypothetical protein
VGEWLLVGYTVALVLMTFGAERLGPDAEAPPPPEMADVEVLAHG